MKTETFTDKKAFLEALHGRKTKYTRKGAIIAPEPSCKATDVSTREPRTGLTTLLLAGWNVSYNAAMQIRLWKGEKDTGYFDDEAVCCARAKEL